MEKLTISFNPLESGVMSSNMCAGFLTETTLTKKGFFFIISINLVIKTEV